MPELVALDPLEIHSGVVEGPRRTPLPEPPAIPGSPAEVLEALLLEALRAPPCHVLFSGGRDSSLILSAAVRAARRHGLPAPIALTARFEGQPLTEEAAWQELMVAHLGLEDWVRLPVDDEFAALGPVATTSLVELGPHWPPNAHNMRFFAQQVDGGTLVTGGGGDELFSPWYWRRFTLAQVRTLGPARRQLKWGAYSMLPLRARQRLMNGGTHVTLPWLRDEVSRELNDRMAASEPPQPSWGAELELHLQSRYHECITTTVRTFAEAEGARASEPFYDPRFVRAVVAASPEQGFSSRGEALAALFGDLLPTAVVQRGTKALFTAPSWGEEAAAFAQAWDGRGVDPELVDLDRLAAEWRKPVPDARTVGLLQHVWLTTRAT